MRCTAGAGGGPSGCRLPSGSSPRCGAGAVGAAHRPVGAPPVMGGAPPAHPSVCAEGDLGGGHRAGGSSCTTQSTRPVPARFPGRAADQRPPGVAPGGPDGLARRRQRLRALRPPRVRLLGRPRGRRPAPSARPASGATTYAQRTGRPTRFRASHCEGPPHRRATRTGGPPGVPERVTDLPRDDDTACPSGASERPVQPSRRDHEQQDGRARRAPAPPRRERADGKAGEAAGRSVPGRGERVPVQPCHRQRGGRSAAAARGPGATA